MSAITPAGKNELIALYLTMFGVAPSIQKLADIVVSRENGNSLAQIATTLAEMPEFAVVASKDVDSFATYLADALLANDIAASARAWAINWTVTQLQGTKSKAQVIAESVQAIISTTNTNYATSQSELSEKVTSALNSIENPPSTIFGAYLEQIGVSQQALIAFLDANKSHLAVNYSYIDQLGISFDEIIEIIGLENEQVELLRSSFVEHGLSDETLGANHPVKVGYNTSSITQLTATADSRNGTVSGDAFHALAGDDKVNGLQGNDLILGGEGNDTLDGGRGRDYLDGGVGDDILYAGTNVTSTGGSSFDSESMSYVDDTTYTFDDIHADILYGRVGNDKLYGGYGSDYLDGGQGNDVLEGDYNVMDSYLTMATATQRASIGNDTLYGGPGADSLKGGNGNDTYLYQGMPGTLEVLAGETISDSGGIDTLWALTGTDFSLLGGGTSTLESMGLDRVLISSGETATLTAKQLSGSSVRINATGELRAQLIIKGSTGTYDFSQLKFDASVGGNAFDSGLDGLTLDFAVQGISQVTGTQLNDTIMIKDQSTVNADAGDDDIFYTQSSTGTLTLNGGSGWDTLKIATSMGSETIELADGFIGSISNVEALSVSQTAVLSIGATASAAWTAGITVNQESTATLTLNGKNSLVSMTATGNAGADLFIGGSAYDTFTGGLGADQFVFNASDLDSTLGRATDSVTDFRKSQGDTIDVSFKATETNFSKSGNFSQLSELLVSANQLLNGVVQIVVGQVGNDTFVVTDSDGKGYTQVIRLIGISLDDIGTDSFVVLNS